MKKSLALFAFVLLAACASDAPPPVKLESDTSAPIKLDVLTVEVVDRSAPNLSGTPYSSNNFEPTITNAVRRWATEKFVAVGNTGEAIIVIRDANLKAIRIPHPDSWFTREQASKYEGHAEIEIEISRRNEHGQVTADASQFVTLPEDPTAPERQNAYNKLLNSLMRELATNLRSGVNDHLASFVSAGSSSVP